MKTNTNSYFQVYYDLLPSFNLATRLGILAGPPVLQNVYRVESSRIYVADAFSKVFI